MKKDSGRGATVHAAAAVPATPMANHSAPVLPVLPSRPGLAGEVLDAIRKRWLLIAALTVAAALLGWALASTQPKRYRASSIAAVAPLAGAVEPADQIRSVQGLDQRTFVATIAALASTPAIETAAQPANERGYRVRAVVLPSTSLLRIEVDGADPRQAAEIANRVPALLSAQATRIFSIYGVTPVSPAAAGELIFPRVERAIAAGLVIGLFLGTSLAWALSRSRTTARP
jgi:capsular polysaccharide biosynthesis protein